MTPELKKLMNCKRGGHDWMPVAWKLFKEAKHVSQVMCKVCFYETAIDTIRTLKSELTAIQSE